MTTPQVLSKTYRPQLDTLRAIAVIAVLFVHFVPTDHFLKAHLSLPYGRLGVRLFFVLSGYLISGILLDGKRSIEVGRISSFQVLKNFYIRRGLRIFPLYYAVLLITSFTLWSSIQDTLIWHLCYCSNILYMLQDDWVRHLPHLWSLAVEEQFYLIWPLALLFSPKRWAPYFLLSMIAVAITWRGYWVHGSGFTREMQLFSNLDSLSIGGILAFLQRQANFSIFRKWMPVAGTAGCITYLIGAFFAYRISWIGDLHDIIGYTAIGLFFAWLIVNATERKEGVIGKVLDNPILQYIGRISYGIYLMHTFTHVIYTLIFQKLQISPPVEFMIATKTIASIGIAALSYSYLEKPILRLKRHFA